MRAACVIRTEFPDKGSAQSAAKAISHEKDVGSRSGTKVSAEGQVLTLSIEAQDVVALRAGANACLRALQAIEGIEKEEVQR